MGNIITRTIAQNSAFEDATVLTDATVSYEQGDILCLKAGLVQKSTVDADTVNHLGIARVKVVSGKIQGPYPGLTDVDAAQQGSRIPGPVYGVVASLLLLAGDAFAAGDLVYQDVTDPQRVTVTPPVGAAAVGVYVGEAVASATAGDRGEVHVGAQFPTAALVL